MDNKVVLKKYTNMLLITILSFIIIVGIGFTVKFSFPNIFLSPSYQVFLRLLFFYMIIIYISLFVYLYKAAKILKIAGKIKARPSLLLIIAVVATPIFFLISFIVFGVISAKASKYYAELSKT